MIAGYVILAFYFRYRSAQDGTEHESLLLASGFWGWSRHFNYVAELSVAFLWTVPAGFNHTLPYFYFIFLLVLLIHRSQRDEAKCAKKYGPYWKSYCERVPYKLVPFVY